MKYSGALRTEDAFELVNLHANEVIKSENRKASTVAVVKTTKKSRLGAALHDARHYVAKVKGFDLEDRTLIPQHESYGVPTTGWRDY